METILMGRDNPNGYKLEELLHKLQQEINKKIEYIKDDDRLVAKQVMCHNRQIVGLLAQAEALQRLSYDILDNMAPNEGPLGNYRIGSNK